MAQNPQLPPKRQASERSCGRLTALDSKYKLDDPVHEGFGSKVIYFPSMPETVDLARKAEYFVTPPTRFMPDGIHVYKGTAPLDIPISFRLAANDEEYCPNGAFSVLQVAALLHAMVLPLGDSTIQNTASFQMTAQAPAEKNAQTSIDADVVKFQASSAQEDSLRPPVTCALELMWTNKGGPGIVCIGYVRDVMTKFGGPWLKGPNDSFNLPSFCDFSFTFVHAPGYGNDYTKAGNNLGQNVHAFANYVRQQFYNTYELAQKSGGGYRGFDAPAQQQTEILSPSKAPDSIVIQVVNDPAVDQLRYHTLTVNGAPVQVLTPVSQVSQNAPPRSVTMSTRDLPTSDTWPPATVDANRNAVPFTPQSATMPFPLLSTQAPTQITTDRVTVKPTGR